MYLLVLKSKIIFDDPDAKYFLVKMLQHLDVEEPIDMSVKDLAKYIEIHDRFVSKGMNFLKERGYVRQDLVFQVGRGRPNTTYYFEPEFLEDLESPRVQFLVSHHQSLINDVLMIDRAKKVTQKRHPLKTANKVLLAVLLAHADECGVVLNLGLADLCSLTGMSKDRLHSQLDRLLELGYIRSCTPGFTGSYLFGAVKGVYFLNLKHWNYLSSGIPGITTIYSTNTITNQNNRNEASQLYDLVRQVLKGKGRLPQNSAIMTRCYIPRVNAFCRCEDRILKIIKFFSDPRFSGAQAMLQLHFELFASFLLSHHWLQLSDLEFDSQMLRDNIRDTVIPKRFVKQPREAGTFPSEDQIDLLIDLLFHISLQIALSVKDLMLKTIELSGWEIDPVYLGQMNHVILPATVKHPVLGTRPMAIESFYKVKQENETGYLIVKESKEPPYDVEVEQVEAGDALDVDDLIRCGLVTQIHRRESNWPKRKSSGSQISESDIED